MLTVAFSPCPNDIFLFRSCLLNHAKGSLFSRVVIKDIESLNALAKTGTVPVIKISAAFYPVIQTRYEILELGTTLGYNCGPKLVGAKPDASLAYGNVGFPGPTTTAFHLFKKFYPCKNPVFMPYSQIPSEIKKNTISAGTIIHESNLIFQKLGLYELSDLGQLWYKRTNLPLPLGCVAISRYLHEDTKVLVRNALEDSLKLSFNERKEALLLAQKYSQEKDLEIIDRFIDTYISQDTFRLSSIGMQALVALWS